jgi:hypothetical protein
VEQLKALFCEDECSIFGQNMSEGSSNLGKVLYKSSIKAYMSQKVMNPLHNGEAVVVQ